MELIGYVLLFIAAILAGYLLWCWAFDDWDIHEKD